ncbi:hypothetical protein H0H87_012698 [Tephrocybe sp. NHM501043]|nr:hypothetical protein H0H87_012698 [Tephrocybe sp. NHM501043]
MYIYRGKISWSDKFRNEAITIIFPLDMTLGAPLYLFTQWSRIPGNLHSKEFSAYGVVKSSSHPSENTIILSYSHTNGTTDLSATYSNNNLFLRFDGGLINEDIAALSLVYQSHIYSRVYTGRFSLEVPGNGAVYKAVDETLLAVSAHDNDGIERLLCVFWQWTETDTVREANADFISPSNGTTTVIDSSFGDRSFTLSLRKDPDEPGPQVLSIAMPDILLKSEVVLGIFSKTFVVRNDTDGFVNCTVTGTQPLADEIFTFGGLGLAALGVPFAFAPTGLGLAFAVGSYAISNIPMVWNLGTSRNGRFTGMPPSDEFKFTVGEQMEVFATRIKNEGQSILIQLAAKTFTKEGKLGTTGPDNKELIVSIKQDLNEADWISMIRLDQAVPVGKSFRTRGFLQLEKFSASIQGTPISINNNDVAMGLYTHDASRSPPALYHGALALSSYANSTLLQYQSSSTGPGTSILFSSLSSGNCRLVRLWPYEPQYLLMMRHVDIMGSPQMISVGSGAISIPGTHRPDGGVQTREHMETQMLHAISLDPMVYPAYYFTPGGTTGTSGTLKGVSRYAASFSVKVLSDGEYPNTYTFLRITKPVVLNSFYP